MDKKFYQQLVDLYAGGELQQELEEALEDQAFHDSELNHEMTTLRRTVDMLKSGEEPEFTEESCQRILMKLYARGAEIEPKSPPPMHIQYNLPIQG